MKVNRIFIKTHIFLCFIDSTHKQAIDKAVIGRTVIVVAHRLSTIRAADQIVVMDNHKIVDVGTHEKLLETSSKYKDLIKRQNAK